MVTALSVTVFVTSCVTGILSRILKGFCFAKSAWTSPLLNAQMSHYDMSNSASIRIPSKIFNYISCPSITTAKVLIKRREKNGACQNCPPLCSDHGSGWLPAFCWLIKYSAEATRNFIPTRLRTGCQALMRGVSTRGNSLWMIICKSHWQDHRAGAGGAFCLACLRLSSLRVSFHLKPSAPSARRNSPPLMISLNQPCHLPPFHTENVHV